LEHTKINMRCFHRCAYVESPLRMLQIYLKFKLVNECLPIDSSFEHSFFLFASGIVFDWFQSKGCVITTMICVSDDAFMTSTALPDRTACVTMAITVFAPLSISTLAARPMLQIHQLSYSVYRKYLPCRRLECISFQ